MNDHGDWTTEMHDKLIEHGRLRHAVAIEDRDRAYQAMLDFAEAVAGKLSGDMYRDEECVPGGAWVSEVVPL